jgi:hypothetical protein
VVVHDLNLVSAIQFPDKTDSPLVIDANAVLAFAIRSQRLELVARWDAQAGEFRGGMKLKRLARVATHSKRRKRGTARV